MILGNLDGENLGGIHANAPPLPLMAHDPITQADITAAAGTTAHGLDPSLAQFNATPTTPIKLSVFRDLYFNGEEVNATRLMSKKLSLVVDDSYMIPTDSPKLRWGVSYYLDYTLAVPYSMGLYSCLPPISDSSWCIRFQLLRPNIELVVDEGAIPYDLRDSCMRIADVGNAALFVIMVEDDRLGRRTTLERPPPPVGDSTTKLSPENRKILIAMFVWMFGHMPLGDLYCMGYPELKDISRMKLCNNVL